MVSQTVTCATDLPKAVFYAGEKGGWSDGRLGQAYDLIVAVRGDHFENPDVGRLLRLIEGQLDSADCELAQVQA